QKSSTYRRGESGRLSLILPIPEECMPQPIHPAFIGSNEPEKIRRPILNLIIPIEANTGINKLNSPAILWFRGNFVSGLNN
ncbi:hypothetical protein WAJ13_20290, partial [Acinetobacter baumannii]